MRASRATIPAASSPRVDESVAQRPQHEAVRAGVQVATTMTGSATPYASPSARDLHALYVERISGRVSVPVVGKVGSRLPLQATGVGKATAGGTSPATATPVPSSCARTLAAERS
ncbi:hypothetical protein [Blastococcus sp. SYSU DS0541]